MSATPPPQMVLTGTGYVPIVPPPVVAVAAPPPSSGAPTGTPTQVGGGTQAAGLQFDGKTFSSVGQATAYLQAKYPGATVTASKPDTSGNVTFSVQQPASPSVTPGPGVSQTVTTVTVDGQSFPSIAAATSYLQGKYPGSTVTPNYSSPALRGTADFRAATSTLTGFTISYPSGAAATQPASQPAGGGGLVGSIESGAATLYGGLIGFFGGVFSAGQSAGQAVRGGLQTAGVPVPSITVAAGYQQRIAMVTNTAAYVFPGGPILHGVGTPSEGAGARVLDVIIGVVPFLPFGELGAAGRVIASPWGRLITGAAIGAAGPIVRGDTNVVDIAASAALGAGLFVAPEIAGGGYNALRGAAADVSARFSGVGGDLMQVSSGGMLADTALGATTGTRAGFTAAEEASLARGTGGLPLPLSARFAAGPTFTAGDVDVLRTLTPEETAARVGPQGPGEARLATVTLVERGGAYQAASTEPLTEEETFQLAARNLSAPEATLRQRIAGWLQFEGPAYKAPAYGAGLDLSMPGREFTEAEQDALLAQNLPRPYLRGAFRPGEAFTVRPVEEAGGEARAAAPGGGGEGPAGSPAPASVPVPRPVAAYRTVPTDVEFISMRTPAQPPPERVTPSMLFTSMAGVTAIRTGALGLGEAELSAALTRPASAELSLGAQRGAMGTPSMLQLQARAQDQLAGAGQVQEEAQAYSTRTVEAYALVEQGAPEFEYGRNAFPLLPGSGGGGAARREAGREDYGYLEVFRQVRIGLGGPSNLDKFVPRAYRRRR